MAAVMTGVAASVPMPYVLAMDAATLAGWGGGFTVRAAFTVNGSSTGINNFFTSINRRRASTTASRAARAARFTTSPPPRFPSRRRCSCSAADCSASATRCGGEWVARAWRKRPGRRTSRPPPALRKDESMEKHRMYRVAQLNADLTVGHAVNSAGHVTFE